MVFQDHSTILFSVNVFCRKLQRSRVNITSKLQMYNHVIYTWLYQQVFVVVVTVLLLSTPCTVSWTSLSDYFRLNSAKLQSTFKILLFKQYFYNTNCNTVLVCLLSKLLINITSWKQAICSQKERTVCNRRKQILLKGFWYLF